MSETNTEISAAADRIGILQRVFGFFASFGLACVVLAFLCLLTFIGTIEMQELGLYETSNVYFESIYIMQEVGPIKVPLPGGMLLMVLLFFNLLCGALIRAKKSWRTPGMLIAHGGILFMLVAGLVAFMQTREGNLILWENEEFGAQFEQAEGGARVTAVDSELDAGEAGLEVGDVLLSVLEPGEDGEFDTKDDERLVIANYPDQEVQAAEQFAAALAGEQRRLQVRRGGEEKEIEVTYSGRAGNESFNLINWVIEIGEYTGEELPEKVLVIPSEHLTPLKKKGSRRVFFSESLPFEIEITRYLQNCAPAPAGSAPDKGKRAVDGFYLKALEVNRLEEENMHGANVRILPKGGGEPIVESLLFGDYPDRGWTSPLTVELDGRRWSVNLTKQRISLPFSIRLEDFTKLEHPGTTKPKEFMSDVTKINADGTSDTSLIEMNKPLRSDQFTVYQASWGAMGAAGEPPLYTSLKVAYNPADQWPKYSCYVVAVGLLIHFFQKLFKYLNRTQRKHKREREAIAAAATD